MQKKKELNTEIKAKQDRRREIDKAASEERMALSAAQKEMNEKLSPTRERMHYLDKLHKLLSDECDEDLLNKILLFRVDPELRKQD